LIAGNGTGGNRETGVCRAGNKREKKEAVVGNPANGGVDEDRRDSNASVYTRVRFVDLFLSF
jgi:hypothetical protein